MICRDSSQCVNMTVLLERAHSTPAAKAHDKRPIAQSSSGYCGCARMASVANGSRVQIRSIASQGSTDLIA